MNILLLFFALPIATIILAVVLQTILRRPVLVAATFFSIYLIVTFAAFDESFLIFAIVYTILAYIAAVITKFIMKLLRCRHRVEEIIEDNDEETDTDTNSVLNTVNLTSTNTVVSANMRNYPKIRYRNFRR